MQKIDKEKLYKYFKNKDVINLVFRVLNYNFKDSIKTNEFLNLFENHLINKNK